MGKKKNKPAVVVETPNAETPKAPEKVEEKKAETPKAPVTKKQEP